ncbi:MAG: VTT domain-containing protein [Candidatus Woesearchaeota archaeon]
MHRWHGIALFFMTVVILGFVFYSMGAGLDAFQIVQGTHSEKTVSVIVLFLLQTAESVVPVFPGVVLAAVAGYTFGTFVGAIISLLANLAGASIVYYLARKIPIDIIIGKHEMLRYESYVKRHGTLAVLVGRMAIVFPNAAISAGASLGRMHYLRFIILSAIGSLPVLVLFSYFGSALTGLHNLPVMPAFLAVLVVLGAFYARRIIHAQSILRRRPGI